MLPSVAVVEAMGMVAVQIPSRMVAVHNSFGGCPNSFHLAVRMHIRIAEEQICCEAVLKLNRQDFNFTAMEIKSLALAGRYGGISGIICALFRRSTKLVPLLLLPSLTLV